MTRGQRWRGVLAHAMSRREETSEQADMGGQRQRRHRHRLIEYHTLARQSLEVRHGDIHEAVGRQSIRTSRVERDQKDA